MINEQNINLYFIPFEMFITSTVDDMSVWNVTILMYMLYLTHVTAILALQMLFETTEKFTLYF